MSEFTLPPNFHEFLKTFIMSVLEDKPGDLVNYAASYFKDCKISRDRKKRQAAEERLASYGVHLTTRICMDSIDEDELWLEISKGRRKAVAALSIDPKLAHQQIQFEEKTDKQNAFLQDAFESVSLLKSCNEQQKKSLISAMFCRNVVKGENIIQQGEDGDNFYIIEKGDFVFHIEFGDYCIQKKMKGKGSFGELALLYDCPRTASVEAISDGILWCLDQKIFKLILLIETTSKQSKFEEILKNSEPLAMLTYDERMKLIDALKMQKYEDGSYIIRQFEKADCMYFLMDGQVKITDGCNEEKEIARLKMSQYFGEFSLANNELQRMNAVAVGEVTCATLEVDAFERLLGPYRQLIARNLDDLQHQHQVDEQNAERIPTYV